MDIMQIPQEHPEHADVRVRDTLLVIIKTAYFIHHTILLIYTTMILVLEPRIFSQFTLSTLLLIFYGFLALELLIFNFIMIIISKQIYAVWCNRLIAKLLIMMFPFFCLIAYFHDKFNGLRSVKSFMVYHCFISLSLIIYQIYSCTWGHHEEPGFLYRPNDLIQHKDDVWARRKEFQMKKKLRRINSAAP